MKKIIVKETSENTYLIYVNVDGINIACEMANNQEEKIISINTFLLIHFYDYTKNEVKDIVEEITL
jgi:hypothetical protein